MCQYVVGAAAGYLLGTKAGRKDYHQIVNAAQAAANSPVTKQVTASARRAIANKIDPEPRMRKVKDLCKGKSSVAVRTSRSRTRSTSRTRIKPTQRRSRRGCPFR
ncbi:hypothetical protein SAMN04488531_0363 [Corynebacterium coyleae]|nr:hypothetical protein SAMN04488531_0363 [Corynebacterium coyleae]